MRVLLFDHPQAITDEQLNASMLLVSAERRSKALQFKLKADRVLAIYAYRLLCQGLREEYGIMELPQFEYINYDKPVLRGYPDIHFNISHCKRGIICVIDNQPIGVDIEETEEKLDMVLCHYCFNDIEVEDIVTAPDPCIRFTHWWTRKEALLKLTGEGLTDNLPALFTPALMEQVKFETHECQEQGFVYTICRFIQ